MIDRHEEQIRHGNSRLRIGASVAVGLFLVVGTVYAAAPGSGDADVRAVDGPEGLDAAAGADTAPPSLAELESRVDRVSRGWAELSAYYEAEVAPIERVLLRYHDDEQLTGRIAAAVVREANAADLEPRLLLGVLLVENPWLDPTARSFMGAVGLMQVMPVHTGGWACGWDLEQIDTNVCLGARVFAHYLDRSDGDMERALLRYNGCVNGTNTPNCHQYPSRVIARAGGPGMLAWAGQGPAAGSP
ncbi:MAG: lytic transglycosylase domain-containing protein [Longimicrobiales bacterium]